MARLLFGLNENTSLTEVAAVHFWELDFTNKL